MRRKSTALLALLATALATSCGGGPQRQERTEPPPEPVTGLRAFFRIYPTARVWAEDVQGLRLVSLSIPEMKPKGGAYPAWRATFYSPSKAAAKSFTFSVVESYGNIHKGVFEGPAESFSPGAGERWEPWPISALKIDSDRAYEVAVQNSQDYIKKHPDQQVTFVLEKTRRHPNLTWRVVWGQSESRSDYSVFIDASTGDVVEKMH